MDEVLVMKNITKRFPGVLALNKVNFSLAKGEVHVLVGENGAGKSTLVKILGGVYDFEDGGEILLNGKKTFIHHTKQANDLGIFMIHQELLLIPKLSVAENINLGKPYPLKRNGLIDWKGLYEKSKRILEELHLNIDTKGKVSRLSVANQQMVEIARVLSNENPKVIIMDEPTAAITVEETKELFKQIRALKSRGVSIIYISHRLDEIKKIGDRLTVMRDGNTIETMDVKNSRKDEIIRLMVGREVKNHYPKKEIKRGKEVLRIENLSVPPKVKNINLTLHQSEILGLAGLVGAGRTEFVRGLFGADDVKAGNIYINGKKVVIRHPYDAVNNGIAFLTEDRKYSGLLLDFSVFKNITLASIRNISNKGFIPYSKEKSISDDLVKKLQIKTPSITSRVKNLSGGNQQKVILARWLCRNADIIILDEPTRGIDVGAKAEIYELINQLVEQKKAVIMISSDMMEVMGLSDRIVVISEGKSVGELKRKDFSQESIMKLAISELAE